MKTPHSARFGAYLTPLAVVALSFGYAVGWGSFVMPGTVFLPGAGPAGTVIGILLGAAAIAVFAFNYHRMLQRVQGPGGAVAFTIKAFGADHGFLLAWFLWLTYVAILWANATALVLLVRYLFGDALQFGFHYTLAGFDVYFGEVVLCILAIAFCGAVCLFRKRFAIGLHTLLASGKSLLRLVDHVLDFSKLESGNMEIVPTQTEVSKLISDVVGAFRTSKKIELRCKVGALPALMVDPQRIGQMLFDLVSNAVKFTTSGFIEVRATFTPGGSRSVATDDAPGGSRPVATDGEVSGTLRIEVEDSGCGIGEEDQKRIMSPYEQLNAKEARHGGTGLGLAFCRQLANAMGGDITVTSALGKGSTFTITLPGVKAAEKAANETAETAGTSSPVVPVVPSVSEVPVVPPSAARRRILIVDDQKMNLVVLKAMLKKLGDFDVVMAADGKQALATLEAPDAQPFDMVLTDMWMPELDGAGLVKAIRASTKLKPLPVHVVTADVELVKRHEEVGFTSIMLKPITVDKIRPVVCGGEAGKEVSP